MGSAAAVSEVWTHTITQRPGVGEGSLHTVFLENLQKTCLFFGIATQGQGSRLDFSPTFSLPCAPLCSAQTAQIFQWPWVCSTGYRTKQTGRWNPSCRLLLCGLNVLGTSGFQL